MTATIETKPLLAALQSASIATEPRVTLPILSCALVEIGKDGATVTCDCLDARITAKAEGVKCEEPFSFCVGVNLLRYALRGETAEISLSKLRLTVKGGGETLLHTLPTDEFPPASNWTAKATETVDAVEFLSALKAALSCSSVDAGRYAICGAHWDKSQECMVATNGTRMCVNPIELPLKASFTLPNSEAKRVLACFSHEDELRIGATESQFCAASANQTLWTKLIEGTYPNYRQVIPTSKAFAVVNREALIASLKSLAVFTEGNNGRVKIDANGAWNIKASKDDGNESSVTLDADQIAKVEPFGVNLHHVLAFLQNWTCDDVAVTMDGNCMLVHPQGQPERLGVTTLMRI